MQEGSAPNHHMHRPDDNIYTVTAAGQNTSHFDINAGPKTRKGSCLSSPFKAQHDNPRSCQNRADTARTQHLPLLHSAWTQHLRLLSSRNRDPIDTAQHEQSTCDCCTALTQHVQLLHSIDEAVTIAAQHGQVAAQQGQRHLRLLHSIDKLLHSMEEGTYNCEGPGPEGVHSGGPLSVGNCPLCRQHRLHYEGVDDREEEDAGIQRPQHVCEACLTGHLVSASSHGALWYFGFRIYGF